MTMSIKHNLYQAQFDATQLDGITRIGGNIGSVISRVITDGDVYPKFQALLGQQPSLSFSSLAIAAALDLCSFTGVAISSLAAGFNLYAQKRLEGGLRAGTLAHRKYNIKEGIVVPTGISADNQSSAEISYQVVSVYDGTNAIIVESDGVTLPTAASNAERFAIGKTTLAGILLEQITSWNLNFGVGLTVDATDADIWPTLVTIDSIAPTLTLRGLNVEWLKSTNIPLLGKLGTHANTAFYLRKRAQGNSYVADVTAEHIKFTGDGAIFIGDPYSAAGADGAQCDLTMYFRDDDTNTPVIINTASAIT